MASASAGCRSSIRNTSSRRLVFPRIGISSPICALAARRSGISILIIDHAVQEVLSIADRVVVLEFGRLLCEGPPETIRNDPEVLRAYFGAGALAPAAEAVA